MDNNQYRIGELAEKAGVTKRTVHYYMGRGLLPMPDGAGLGTTYTDEHLYRILLIKKLQDAFLPLDEIRKRTADLTLEEIKRCLAGEAAKPPANSGANSGAAAFGKTGNSSICNNTGSDGCSRLNDDAVTGLNYETKIEEAMINDEAKNQIIAYARIELGLGLELHFPADSDKARKLADILYRYAEKMIREG